MIIDIYKDMLIKKNLSRKKIDNMYRPSSSGMCSRKIYFESIEKPDISLRNKPNASSLALMQNGTEVHKHFQKTILKADLSEYHIDEIKTEYEIVNEKIGLHGFIDILVFFENGEIHVYDIKTVGAYPWKLRFGRNKNASESTSTSYKYQLGVYGASIKKEFGRCDKLGLIYYNRDTALMKEVDVGLENIDLAIDFWIKTKRQHEAGLPPLLDGESPVMKWEFNKKYCNFFDLCQERG